MPIASSKRQSPAPTASANALSVVLLLVALSSWSAPAGAGQIMVPEEHARIQAAIDAARDGDVISLAPGRYYESVSLKGKSIILRARQGLTGEAILDGNQVTGSLVRCVSGEGPNTRLINLVFTNGRGDGELHGPQARVGGALILIGASPTIVNCRFQGNEVTYNGGAIFARNSNAQLRGCTFESNTAEKGGGIFASGGDLNLQDCTFEENRASFGGGAIFADNRSRVRIEHSRFIGNRASFNGGALYDYDSATTVTDSIFVNNIAGYKGGGAYHGWRSRGRIGDTNEFRTPNDDVAGSARSLNQADPLGACFVGLNCVLTRQAACIKAKGIWAGPDTRCDEAEVPEGMVIRPGGDLNEDGRVDVRDISLLLTVWGSRSDQ